MLWCEFWGQCWCGLSPCRWSTRDWAGRCLASEPHCKIVSGVVSTCLGHLELFDYRWWAPCATVLGFTSCCFFDHTLSLVKDAVFSSVFRNRPVLVYPGQPLRWIQHAEVKWYCPVFSLPIQKGRTADRTSNGSSVLGRDFCHHPPPWVLIEILLASYVDIYEELFYEELLILNAEIS